MPNNAHSTEAKRIFEEASEVRGDPSRGHPTQTRWLTPAVMELFERRTFARAEGNFALADVLRDELLRLGFEVHDLADGTHIHAAPRSKSRQRAA